jgi:CheY-like chemotaxis protein
MLMAMASPRNLARLDALDLAPLRRGEDAPRSLGGWAGDDPSLPVFGVVESDGDARSCSMSWAARPAPALGAGPCDRHVLVVDDEPAIGEVLHELLQDEGWRVTTRPAPPTIEEIGELRPDVIVLDLIFGGANAGSPFLAALRARATTAAIPVVVCTAALEQMRLLQGIGPDGLGVVAKPFDLDEIVWAVTAARESQERAS